MRKQEENKWKDIPYPLTETVNIIKISVVPKLIQKSNTFHMKYMKQTNKLKSQRAINRIRSAHYNDRLENAD